MRVVMPHHSQKRHSTTQLCTGYITSLTAPMSMLTMLNVTMQKIVVAMVTRRITGAPGTSNVTTVHTKDIMSKAASMSPPVKERVSPTAQTAESNQPSQSPSGSTAVGGGVNEGTV